MRVLTTVVLVALTGCVAETKAKEGLQALEACDYRTANLAFEAAFDAAPGNPDFALAYALTTIAVIGEDPNVQRFATRVGFTAPLDTSMLWGKEGILSQLSSRSSSCSSVSDYLVAKVPHPSVRSMGPPLYATFDRSLTMGDAREALLGLAPRFEKLARAAQVAAEGIDAKPATERFVTIKGGCGVGQIAVQAPELMTVAAVFRILNAAVEASKGYDGAINVRTLFDSGYQSIEPFYYLSDRPTAEAWVSQVGNRLLRVTSPADVKAARPKMLEAIQTAKKIAPMLRRVNTPINAALDWRQLPFGWVDDAEAFVTFAETALSKDEPTPIATFSPELRMNVYSFFERPYQAPSPLYAVEARREADGGMLRREDGGILRFSDGGTDFADWSCVGCQSLGADLGVRFVPNVTSSPGWSGNSFFRWGTWESNWRPLIDPGGRWSQSFTCR